MHTRSRKGARGLRLPQGLAASQGLGEGYGSTMQRLGEACHSIFYAFYAWFDWGHWRSLGPTGPHPSVTVRLPRWAGGWSQGLSTGPVHCRERVGLTGATTSEAAGRRPRCGAFAPSAQPGRPAPARESPFPLTDESEAAAPIYDLTASKGHESRGSSSGSLLKVPRYLAAIFTAVHIWSPGCRGIASKTVHGGGGVRFCGLRTQAPVSLRVARPALRPLPGGQLPSSKPVMQNGCLQQGPGPSHPAFHGSPGPPGLTGSSNALTWGLRNP